VALLGLLFLCSGWYNGASYCAIGYQPHQYTYFFGDRTKDMYTSTFYDQRATEGPWGWYPAACTSGYIYICKIRANDYPCNPPPAPTPPPPSPPSPPIPPLGATCKRGSHRTPS
jgi:hypothetical protein